MAMDTGKTLSDLPPELIEWIGSFLEAQDLLDLRPVSKGVVACTEKQLLEQCYSGLAFIPALRMSLNRMQALAQHPHLLRQIRPVTLYIDVPHDNALKGSVMREQRDSDDQSRETRRLRRSLRSQYKAVAADYQGVVQSAHDAACLQELFASIAQVANHGIRLRFRSMYQSHGWLLGEQDIVAWQSRDCRRFEHECGEFQLLCAPQEWITRLLTRFLTAVQQSGVRACEFVSGGHGVLFPYEIFESPSLENAGLSKLHHITQLQFRLDDDSMGNPGIVEGSVRYTVGGGFISFLDALAPTLQSCRLSAEASDGFRPLNSSMTERTFNLFLNYLFFPVLKRLSFEDLPLRYTSLLGFIGKHASILDELYYDEC